MRYEPSWPVIPVISATLNGRDGGGFCPFEVDPSVAIVEEEGERSGLAREGKEGNEIGVFFVGEKERGGLKWRNWGMDP